MATTELAFRVGQVLFAALVATVPLLYPRHSLYTRRAQSGIDKMIQLDEERNGLRIGWVGPDDRGFKQLHRAIDHYRPLDGTVCKIGTLKCETRQDLNEYLDSYYGSAIQPNYALFVEYQDGRREPVICHPFDPHQTKRLTELREWIRSSATIRSNYLTTGLAILWTSIAISSVIFY